MAKQNILIVDSDPESVKVLEVSLKKAGYSVTKSPDGLDALEMIGFAAPDLVISDTKMPNLDGFGLYTKLKENEETAHIPFIFLTAEKSIEDKIRGLELGVEDYLNKPIFIREILVRVNLALQRRQKESLENREEDNKTKFSGSLQDMGVVDLLQTIDLGHKSGVLHLTKKDDSGQIFFKEGQVIDAITATRKGEDAVYRMLVWSEGEFEIEFDAIEREQTISLNTQGLLMEGMRRLDEWGRLQEQLPPLTSVFDVDEDILAERLGEIPDEVNTILRHFDGKAPLMEVVNRSGLGDLEALTVITKLFFEGLILEVPPMPTIPAPAQTEAILSDDSMTSDIPSDVPSRVPAPPSDPPHVHLPSHVVDDAMGPHLSIAANDPLGFVRALTQSVPPPAPLMNADPDDAFEKLSKISEASSVSPIHEPEPSMPKVEIAKIETIKKAVPIPSVENDHETMLGMTRPDPVSLAKTESAPHPLEEETSEQSEVFDTKDIAAAIDAELPPPEDDDETESDETSTSSSGFFDGASYKASFNPRPSYDPAPAESDADRVPDSDPKEAVADTVAEESKESKESWDESDEEERESEYEEDIEEDEDEDEPWDEIEEPPSVPSNLKPLFAIVALLVIAGVIGVVWFVMTDEPAKVADKEEKEEVAVSSLVPEVNKKSNEGVDHAKANEAKPAESGTDKAEPDKAAENPKAEASAADTPETNPTATPAAGDTPQVTSVSDEVKDKVKKLLKSSARARKPKKIKILKEVLTLDATNEKALSALSIELMEDKQTREEAMNYAKKARAINAKNAATWLAIGYINQLNGNAEEAKEAYTKCAACPGPAKYVRDCRGLAR